MNSQFWRLKLFWIKRYHIISTLVHYSQFINGRQWFQKYYKCLMIVISKSTIICQFLNVIWCDSLSIQEKMPQVRAGTETLTWRFWLALWMFLCVCHTEVWVSSRVCCSVIMVETVCGYRDGLPRSPPVSRWPLPLTDAHGGLCPAGLSWSLRWPWTSAFFLHSLFHTRTLISWCDDGALLPLLL